MAIKFILIVGAVTAVACSFFFWLTVVVLEETHPGWKFITREKKFDPCPNLTKRDLDKTTKEIMKFEREWFKKHGHR